MQKEIRRDDFSQRKQLSAITGDTSGLAQKSATSTTFDCCGTVRRSFNNMELCIRSEEALLPAVVSENASGHFRLN
jgi:hypothetical protein